MGDYATLRNSRVVFDFVGATKNVSEANSTVGRRLFPGRPQSLSLSPDGEHAAARRRPDGQLIPTHQLRKRQITWPGSIAFSRCSSRTRRAGPGGQDPRRHQVSEYDAAVNGDAGDGIGDECLIAFEQKLEHYEIAGYHTLQTQVERLYILVDWRPFAR
jgi:hypothetical protein